MNSEAWPLIEGEPTPWPIQKEIPLHGEGEQSTKFGGPWPYWFQPPLLCTWENDCPALCAAGAGAGGGVFEVEGVVELLLEVPFEGEVVDVEVLVGEEVVVLEDEEVDVPLELELALGSELPEHPFNRKIHKSRVNRAAYCGQIRFAYFFWTGKYRR